FALPSSAVRPRAVASTGRGRTRLRRGGRRCAGVGLAVEARGLVKRFGDTTAVDDADLTVAAGGVHGLLGPNGAGKTTVLRMLFGLVRPDAGTLRLFGRDPRGHRLDGLAGFVESPRFYPYLSGERNLALLADLDGGAAP